MQERESWLWLLYLYVYLSLGLSYVNWASQECCLFYLRSSLRSSDLLLFHFLGLFPSLSVAPAILDSFSLFYLPNTAIHKMQYAATSSRRHSKQLLRPRASQNRQGKPGLHPIAWGAASAMRTITLFPKGSILEGMTVEALN